MKPNSLFRGIVVMALVILALHLVAPLGQSETLRTCKEGFNACIQDAAFGGPFYYLYCLQGYAFCKQFIEKS